jgi:hypothetical protein
VPQAVAKPVGKDARQQAKNFDDRDLLVAVAQRRALSVVPRPRRLPSPIMRCRLLRWT